MHIIIFTHTKGLSGGARQALYQAKYVFEKGIKTTFLCIQNTPLYKELIDASIPVEILKETWRQRAKQIENLIDKDEETVIHSFHSPGLKLLSFYGILWKMKYPHLVCVAHRGVSMHPRNPFPYWSPGIDAFIPNSNCVKKQLEHFLPFSKRVHAIQNGLSIERTTPTESKEDTRARLNLDPTAFVMISIVNSSPRKGLDDLLQAFSLVKKENIYLIIIGLSQQIIEEKITNHPKKDYIRTVFTQEVMNFLYSSNLFIFPSREFDSMPNVILEAMAFSLPIIATDVGGTRELINNNGILIPPNNPIRMAEAITKCIENPKLLEEYSEKSTLLSKEFTTKKRVEKLLTLYESLLKKKRKKKKDI